MALKKWTSRQISDGEQVDQWFMFMIGCFITTIPAIFLMPIFGWFTYNYKVTIGDTDEIDKNGCFFFAFLSGCACWILGAFLFGSSSN